MTDTRKPLSFGLARLGFTQPPPAPVRTRGAHTNEHRSWDQGGYCMALVEDENGYGDVCGHQEPATAPEPVTGALCVLTEGNDAEAHAMWFNDGYETAVAQGLADDPTLAGDWLEEQREKAGEAAVAALHLEESEHRFDPIGGADEIVCALCGLDPEAGPHQHFERLWRAIRDVRAIVPEDQPDVMYDEKMLEGYRLALADVNAVLDHYFGPVKS